MLSMAWEMGPPSWPAVTVRRTPTGKGRLTNWELTVKLMSDEENKKGAMGGWSDGGMLPL